MFFLARVLDPVSREVSTQRVEARDAVQAESVIAAAGHRVLDLKPAPAMRSWLKAGLGRSVEREVVLFCRELSSLLKAGLSVVEALEALEANQQRQGSDKSAATGGSFYSALLRHLRDGKSLSTALAEMPGVPPLLVASVQASERTSNLVSALDSYLRYADLTARLRSRIVSAALYPSIVIALGIVITLFLLSVVVPRFAALYAQMGPAAGGTTRLLLGLSTLLKDHPWLLPLVGLLLLGGVAGLIVNGRWKRVLAWVIDAVPWLRHQALQLELTRLYEALAMLSRGGFSLHESLDLCKTIASGTSQRERLGQAQHLIAQGVSVSRAFAASSITNAVTERLLRAGERGGDFGAVLHAVSQRHAESFETFVDRATRVVEPLLLLVVAVLVGGLVVTLYMPIFDIASSIR
ncbi:type II secretion system F family protein [Roseateles asaccharophilus]|uniref:General secretion pathway protein F n=1 Tax=Roseateles asaccharophilus TaxID=582607 RepID=A0ABU2AG09_9BURK|nr:type II secretion system F family protein [Roseateles asaccharophilus]MDR7335397.1 general secretion pathway protein F [Roseateles asaccharophilus]